MVPCNQCNNLFEERELKDGMCAKCFETNEESKDPDLQQCTKCLRFCNKEIFESASNYKDLCNDCYYVEMFQNSKLQEFTDCGWLYFTLCPLQRVRNSLKKASVKRQAAKKLVKI